MKKILTIVLTLCLLVTVVSSFAMASFAATKVDVMVGQTFEWNDHSADPQTKSKWFTSNGVSPDGLWTYKVYVLAKDLYIPVVLHSEGYMIESEGFAWNAKPGDTGIGYARVMAYGTRFHPGEAADIVKVFTCPSGGTITLDTTIARVHDWVGGDGGTTPTSFAVYLEDQLVYPQNNEYETLTSTQEKKISFDVNVKENQRLFIHIGAVDAQQSGDAVNMVNTVTYKSVNDDVAEIDTTTTSTSTKDIPSASIPDFTDGPATDKDKDSTRTVSLPGGGNDDSSNTGLIIGVVAAVVVVAAAAVVIVIKKKKQ